MLLGDCSAQVVTTDSDELGHVHDGVLVRTVP
jgi:hypothetical protein